MKKKPSGNASNKKSDVKQKNRLNNKSKTGQQYVLQIGSFKAKAKAVTLVDRLTDRGYPTFFSRADISGKAYYRVKCGPFKSESKADEYKRVLAKKEGIHGFVTRAEK
ncbi:MAG: hypothetical protein GY846_25360 [Deltaproteobacteria bacterium]|nr:hypothetical protein [Deltaproteobacteria bacterium]